MINWQIDHIIHFGPGEFVKDGLAHFGFHVREGQYYAIEHQKHFIGAVDAGGSLLWTLAIKPVFADVPNIEADLRFPMSPTCSRSISPSFQRYRRR